MTEADWRHALFEWVIGHVAPHEALQASEGRILSHLATILASDDSRATLLPRVPAIIPQLMNSLRQEGASTQFLAERVVRDPHLVAEVIRVANSVQARASEPVADIAQAIERIGVEGLRRAIARVLLKPMFSGSGETLSARCAPRLWEHSQAEATACQQAATLRGIDPFEGYLAGLMHGIGWTAALRAIDRSEIALPAQFSQAFVARFDRAREAFFAKLVVSWKITDELTALGNALLQGDPSAARSPLGEALREAGHYAANEVLAAHSMRQNQQREIALPA